MRGRDAAKQIRIEKEMIGKKGGWIGEENQGMKKVKSRKGRDERKLEGKEREDVAV